MVTTVTFLLAKYMN